MTTDRDDIASLLERVKAATGPDRALDWYVADATGHQSFNTSIQGMWPPFMKGSRADKAVPTYTASIDAALGLVGRMLPGWKWGVASVSVRTGEKSPEGYPRYGEGFRAHVTEFSGLRPMPSVAEAQTAPLAILAALLTSLKENHRD